MLCGNYWDIYSYFPGKKKWFILENSLECYLKWILQIWKKKSRQWHHLKTPCLLLNLHASIDPEHLNTQRHCNMYFCTYLTNGNTNFIKEILLFFLYNTGGPLQVDNQYVIFLLLFFLDILFRFTYDRPSSKRLKLVLFLLFTLKIQYFEEDWYFFQTQQCVLWYM